MKLIYWNRVNSLFLLNNWIFFFNLTLCWISVLAGWMCIMYLNVPVSINIQKYTNYESYFYIVFILFSESWCDIKILENYLPFRRWNKTSHFFCVPQTNFRSVHTYQNSTPLFVFLSDRENPIINFPDWELNLRLCHL